MKTSIPWTWHPHRDDYNQLRIIRVHFGKRLWAMSKFLRHLEKRPRFRMQCYAQRYYKTQFGNWIVEFTVVKHHS